MFSSDSSVRIHDGLLVARACKLKMVLKKVDNRIRILIENGVQTRHRSMFVIVGDKGRDQVSLAFEICSISGVMCAEFYVLLNLAYYVTE